MPSEITPAKNNIFVEETDFKSAISEQLLQKLGGSINFINDKQFSVFDFRFLGNLRPIATGEDGAYIAINNFEIVGIAFRCRDCGSSGVTEIDLHKIGTDGTDAGSILTNKIKISSSENNEAGFFTNFVDNTSNNAQNAASQMPTMTDSNRNIDAGESIRIDIDAAAAAVKDLIVLVYYRPR